MTGGELGDAADQAARGPGCGRRWGWGREEGSDRPRCRRAVHAAGRALAGDAEEGDALAAQFGDVEVAGGLVLDEVEGVHEAAHAVHAGQLATDRPVRGDVQRDDVAAAAVADDQELVVQRPPNALPWYSIAPSGDSCIPMSNAAGCQWGSGLVPTGYSATS